MSEAGDYSPGEWKGHDFAEARKAYDTHVGRSYAAATAKGTTAVDLVPEKIETQSPAPLIILCDVTGSMGAWPATIFSKLPYLDNEAREYLGPDMEISFGAVGDATASDKYPVQARPFAKGTDMATRLKELVVEGGGGSGYQESYDLAALYYARNCHMPKAERKPILILIGDEGLYEFVPKAMAARFHIKLTEPRIDLAAIFEEVRAKFSTYIIRKTYHGRDSEIEKQWLSLLGEGRVIPLDQAQRCVDVIFGILAQETGKVGYFHKEIEGRQQPAQVATVYKSLKKTLTAMPLVAPDPATKSVLHNNPAKAPKSKSLIK